MQMIETIQSLLKDAYRALKEIPKENSEADGKLDAEYLLCSVLNISRATLISYPEKEIAEAQVTQFKEAVQRRARGEPIAYILGYKEFWDLTLKVTADTLIPRPETEMIVEWVLTEFPDKKSSAKKVLDLGTGSGAIALAIAKARTNWEVWGVDNSLSALEVAIDNAKHNQINNIHFLNSHWFAAIQQEAQFDIILANPPYIAQNDPHLKEGDVRFEPIFALVGGVTGLEQIAHIVHFAPTYLKNNGLLMIEHGWDQGASVQSLFLQAGFKEIQTLKDLGEHPRVTLGYYKA